MNARLRSDRRRRRRRALALPFVITTSAATACVVHEGPPPENATRTAPAGETETTTPDPVPAGSAEQPSGAGETGSGEAAPDGQGGIVNTAPNQTPSAGAHKGPGGESTPGVAVNPPPPEQKLPAAPAEGGRVVVRKDGTCHWHVDVDCPKGAICNPPPPRQVQCPEEDK